jgi:hypothetical protein
VKLLFGSLALLLLPLPAWSETSPNKFGLRLTDPAGPRQWTAGSVQRLAISLDLTAAAAQRVHEWEAFLSLDGGQHYAMRLTPHLDLDRLETTFVVPSVPSDDVRLLLRVGDEQQEHEIEVDTRFRIEPAAMTPRALCFSPALLQGEPARPGEQGVSQWIEGVGAAQRQIVASAPGRALHSDSQWDAVRDTQPFVVPKTHQRVAASSASTSTCGQSRTARPQLEQALAALPNFVSLSKHSRRNE